jgi:hypothetical protein
LPCEAGERIARAPAIPIAGATANYPVALRSQGTGVAESRIKFQPLKHSECAVLAVSQNIFYLCECKFIRTMKKLITITLALIVFLIGISFVAYLYKKKILADDASTRQFSPALIEWLKGKSVGDFAYAPAEIDWQEKFLVVEDAVVELEDGYLRCRYNRRWNELLNTDRFLPGDDINGLVWVHGDALQVGEYDSGAPAWQSYYVLFFLDVKQNAILAQRDTIWGGMPSATLSVGQSGGVGNPPKEEDVLAAIRTRTENQQEKHE